MTISQKPANPSVIKVNVINDMEWQMSCSTYQAENAQRVKTCGDYRLKRETLRCDVINRRIYSRQVY